MRFSTSWDRVSVLQCLTLLCQNVALFSCLNHLLIKEDGLEDFIATVISHAIVQFGCRSRLPPFRQQHAITRQHWRVIMQSLAHLIVFEFWRNYTETHLARGKKQNISNISSNEFLLPFTNATIQHKVHKFCFYCSLCPFSETLFTLTV